MPVTIASELGTLVLPDGLTLAAEDALAAPFVQVSSNLFGGNLAVQRWPILAGLPLTLVGGRSGAITWDSQLERWQLFGRRSPEHPGGSEDQPDDPPALVALILAATPDDPLTLTLQDGSVHTVIGRFENGRILTATPQPAVGDRPPSDPPDSWKYVIDRLPLMTA